MLLKLNSTGPAVSNLQKNLVSLLFPIQITSVFDMPTLSAVKAFQLSHGLDADGVVGPLTQSGLAKALIAQIPNQSVPGGTPWMDWMKSHLGEPMVTGSAPTAFDKEVFEHTHYGNLDGVMEPGCAATVCAALEETGFISTENAAAHSYADYGDACGLVPACIVVFQWSSGHYHVGFCHHIVDADRVAVLGGNQSRSLNVSTFSRKFIVATRWPQPALQKGI